MPVCAQAIDLDSLWQTVVGAIADHVFLARGARQRPQQRVPDRGPGRSRRGLGPPWASRPPGHGHRDNAMIVVVDK